MPGAAPYGAPPAPSSQTNGLAVGALVTGILSLVMFWACFVGILLGIIAVVLGILGRKKATEMNGNGAGLALGGLITGALGLVASVVILLTWTVFSNDISNDLSEINSDPSDGVCDESRFIQDPDC